MESQTVPVDLTISPPFSDSWKVVMKWPKRNTAHPPISFDFPDQDVSTVVYLYVRLPPPQSPFLPPLPVNPSHLPWSIRWHLGKDARFAYERIVEVERAAPILSHLTNWGPVTKFVHPEIAADMLRIPIASLTLQERQILELLALTQRVEEPDGVWNCQHWIAAILARATDVEDPVMVSFGVPLLTVQEMKTALGRARTMK